MKIKQRNIKQGLVRKGISWKLWGKSWFSYSMVSYLSFDNTFIYELIITPYSENKRLQNYLMEGETRTLEKEHANSDLRDKIVQLEAELNFVSILTYHSICIGYK